MSKIVVSAVGMMIAGCPLVGLALPEVFNTHGDPHNNGLTASVTFPPGWGKVPKRAGDRALEARLGTVDGRPVLLQIGGGVVPGIQAACRRLDKNAWEKQTASARSPQATIVSSLPYNVSSGSGWQFVVVDNVPEAKLKTVQQIIYTCNARDQLIWQSCVASSEPGALNAPAIPESVCRPFFASLKIDAQ
jgi:hypothetical protein